MNHVQRSVTMIRAFLARAAFFPRKLALSVTSGLILQSHLGSSLLKPLQAAFVMAAPRAGLMPAPPD